MARIEPETGNIIFGVTPAEPSQEIYDPSPAKISVSGRNLGDGHGIYSGTSGNINFLLDFRSLIAGEGVTISGDKNSLIISSPANSSTPNLEVLPGVLSVGQGGTGRVSFNNNALLVGNGNAPLQAISLPTANNQYLSFNNGQYSWGALPPAPNQISTEVVSQDSAISVNRIVQANGDKEFRLELKRNFIDIGSLTGVLSATKGGTGLSVVPTGSLVIGDNNNTFKILPQPASGSYELVADGNTIKWETRNNFDGFAISSNSPYLSVNQGYVDEVNDSLELDLLHTNIPINQLSGTLGTNKGGTGLTNVGTVGQFLRSNGTGMVWQTVDLKDGTVKSVKVSSNSTAIDVTGDTTITNTGEVVLNFVPSVVGINTLNGVLGYNKGGTGLSSIGQPNQILVVNAAGNGLDYVDMDSMPLPGLALVATTGLYSDLLNKPVLSPVATSGLYSDLIAAPNLATVATTGDYNDLINIPASTGGTVTSVGVTSSNNKLAISGSPITSNGTITINVNENNLVLQNMSGIVPVAKGGTGVSSIAEHRMMVGGQNNTIRLIGIPSEVGDVLTFLGEDEGVEWAHISETVPFATTTTPGIIRVGYGLSVSVNGTLENALTDTGDLTNSTGFIRLGDISEVGRTNQYSDLFGLPDPYHLPVATANRLGGIKIGTGVEMDAEDKLNLKIYKSDEFIFTPDDDLIIPSTEYDGDISIAQLIIRYELSTGVWNNLTTGSPATRSESGISYITDGVIITGGNYSNGSEMFYDEVWTYVETSPDVFGWTQLANLPVQLSCHGQVTIDDYVYVFGGYYPDSDSTSASNDLYKYSINDDTWELIPAPSVLPSERACMIMGEIDGKIYMYGGQTDVPEDADQLWVYDPVTNSWEMKADNPYSFGSSGVVRNGKLVVFVGGSTDVKEYDPLTDTWENIGSTPEDNSEIIIAIDENNNIYKYGDGMDGNSMFIFKPDNTVEILANSKPGRAKNINFCLGDLFYVFGGYERNLPIINYFESFKQTNGSTWLDLPSSAYYAEYTNENITIIPTSNQTYNIKYRLI